MPKKPHLSYLLFYVTSRCNLRCKHCFYLDELNQHSEMTVEEIKLLAASLKPLSFVRLTGGEPFLRKDIPEVVSAFYQLAGTKRMGIITNGIRPEWVEERTSAIMETCRGLSLDVGVSIDGLEAIHDEIRGVKGAFGKARETVNRLISLKQKYPQLTTSLVTTVTAKNEPFLEAVYNELASWDVDRLSVNHVRGMVHDPSLKEISFKSYLDFAQKCEEYHFEKQPDFKSGMQQAKNRMTRQAIEQVVRGEKTPIPCLAGSSIGVLYSDGELYLCEMFNGDLPKEKGAPEAHARLGNVKDAGFDFYRLWHSEEAQRCRDWIKITNCSCSHECFLTASILFGKSNYPRLLLEWGKSVLKK